MEEQSPEQAAAVEEVTTEQNTATEHGFDPFQWANTIEEVKND